MEGILSSRSTTVLNHQIDFHIYLDIFASSEKKKKNFSWLDLWLARFRVMIDARSGGSFLGILCLPISALTQLAYITRHSIAWGQNFLCCFYGI